jgi:signal transduction histidine kinase
VQTLHDAAKNTVVERVRRAARCSHSTSRMTTRSIAQRRPPAPIAIGGFWRALWLRIAIQGALIVGAIFLGYEIVERTLLANASVSTLFALHLARGMGTAFLLGTWAFLDIRRARLDCDARMAEDVEKLEVRVRERTRELEEYVTEHRNLEAQVRHQETMASLGVLAAGFAHDLGNPLASLSTELELLEGETDVARFRESLGVLRRHVARMSRTLREMVDFARRRRDEIADVSIASAVADSARLVCHDPRWKRVQLAVDVPSDLPHVHMVEDHLVLVLVNLMLNAADAMPDGGTLTISARFVDGRVDLRVRDTGSGMKPEVLAKAMTPMFTTKARGRGTGLGLAVSNNVVRSVGGELALSSTAGIGTEVAITLPVGGGDA